MISENYQTILWTVYGARVLLFPVVTGYLVGKDKRTIDLLDVAPQISMMGFLWPVLFALCIIVLVMILIGVVIDGIAMLPILFGVFIRSLVDMKTKKERKQK